MQKQTYAFIFTGPQGAGKGTQAALLIQSLKKNFGESCVYNTDTGREFRELLKGDSYVADLVRGTINAGKLQPAFLATYMWTKQYVAALQSGQHVIIDGSPRSALESQNMAEAVEFFGATPVVVRINLSREDTHTRLALRGRNDDNVESIDFRLDQYEQTSFPAIEKFVELAEARLLDINGNQNEESVFADIQTNLKDNNIVILA
jgi:adenylate kinase